MITEEELVQELESQRKDIVHLHLRVDSLEVSMTSVRRSVEGMVTTLKAIIGKDC